MNGLTPLGDPDAVVCVDGVCFIPGATAGASGVTAAGEAEPDPSASGAVSALAHTVEGASPAAGSEPVEAGSAFAR